MKKLLLQTLIIFIALFTLIPRTNAQTFPWAKGISGTTTTDDEGLAIASDTLGHEFVTGGFSSPSLAFGTTTLTNTGNFDIFLAKYDSNGNALWAVNATGSNRDISTAVCTDLFGNSIIAGYFLSPTLGFNTYTLSTPGAFLAKYDSNGNFLWARSANGGEGNSVATDSIGNVYFAGSFQSTIVFGTYTLTNSGSFDTFLVKYDPNGNIVWAKKFGNAGNDNAYSVTTHNSHVFISGRFTSPTLAIGSTTLTNSSTGFDIFVAKFDSNGNTIWAKNAGGTNDDGAYSITTDSGGNSYITGYFSSASANFGSLVLTNGGTQNAFVFKLDPSGSFVWVRSGYGNGSSDVGYSINAHPNGVFVTGGFASLTITFGTLTFPKIGYDSMFIVEYDFNGNPICASVLASGGDDLNGVCTDKLGNAYITSDFMVNPFVVGTTTLTLSGSENIFVAKYNCPIVSGLGQIRNNFATKIFPNPNNGNFQLQIDNAIESGEIILINSVGQKVYEQTISQGLNNIHASNLPCGLYNCIVRQKTGQIINSKLSID